MKEFFLTLFGIAVSLVLTGAAVAQNRADAQDGQNQPEESRLYVDQTFILSTDSDIGSVDTSNTSVCEARLISPRQISLTGRGHGRCYITLVPLDAFADAEARTVRPVVVTTDPKKFEVLEEFLKTQIPQSEIRLIPDPSSDRVIIRGTVQDRHTAELVTRLVTGAERDAESVINLLEYHRSAEKLIQQRFPGRDLRISHTPGSKDAVVRGTIQNINEAQQILDAVQRALPDVEIISALNTTINSEWIQSLLQKMYPDARISLKPDRKRGNLLLTGAPADSQQAADIHTTIVSLGVPEEQIIDQLEFLQDTRVLERFLQAEFPDASISLVSVPASDRLVLRGTLASAQEARQLWAIMDAAGVPPDHVVDLVQVVSDGTSGTASATRFNTVPHIPLNYPWTPRNTHLGQPCTLCEPSAYQNHIAPPTIR